MNRNLRDAIGMALVGVGFAVATVWAFDRDTEALPVTPTTTVTASPVVNGPGWLPVDTELADALSEGDSEPPENADTRDWEACLAHTENATLVIVCPDGYVTSL